jgi:formyl-CoA transferase
MKVAVAIVDVTAGLFATAAILAALHERERSGEGQYLDIALLDSQVAWLINVGSNYLVSGEIPKRYGNAHPNIVPYEPFKARDGWVALGVGTDHQWRRFCELAGCQELADDPRFATNPKRVENREVLVPLLQEVFKKKDAREWLNLLLEAGIPCAPINNVKEVFDDPQVRARDMVVEVPHPTAGTVKLAGSPIKMSRTPVQIKQHPPLLGEHTEEILTTLLGYSREEIEQLRAEEVI